MILPLLVFIVVIIIIAISFKTEHFQSSTSSSSSITEAATTVVTKPVTVSNVTFLINTDITPPLMSTTQLANFINFLKTQVVNSFSIPDYQFTISHTRTEAEDQSTGQNTPTQTSNNPTDPTDPSQSVLVTQPRFNTYIEIRFTKLLDVNVLSEGIENMKVDLFGGVNSFFYNIEKNTSGLSTGAIQISLVDTGEAEFINQGTYVSGSTVVDSDESDNTTTPSTTQPVHRLDKKTILSKSSCVHTENKCNVGYKPFSYLEFNHNKKTDKPYSNREKTTLKTRFKERCDNEEDAEEVFCCDANDTKLDNVYSYIPYELRSKFKNVVVDKCNNKINSIKVCDGTNCNSEDDNPRQATSYELCKLQNVTDTDINNEGIVNMSKLMPDCYEGKCEDVGKLLELDPEDQNVRITDHYYLIDAIKNNNVEYLKSYYHNKKNNVNDKLEYGYPGNTVLHQAIFDHMDDVVQYLLTLKVDLTKVNKDGNSAFHIACLKGNYDAVHQLLKLGASINCTNNHSDTPLHCAMRSGSYNTALILLNNGANMVLSSRNKYGEIPLHTAVISKKKNQKIVELLVEYGSPIHSKNNYEKTILGSLLKEGKTVVRETMRTFLQRMYYTKYDEDKYNEMLQKHPEIRPFEIDTDIPEKLQKDYKNYDSRINYKELIKYDDEFVNNKDLYLEKDTRALKANIDSKYFDDDKVSQNNDLEETFVGNKLNKNTTNVNNVSKNTNNRTNMEKKLNNSILKNADKAVMISTFTALIVLIIVIFFIYLKN